MKLSCIFGVSIEGLSGIKMPVRPKRRLSPAGVRHAERYQMWSKMEQLFVSRIIGTLLEKKAVRNRRRQLIKFLSAWLLPQPGLFFFTIKP